MIGLSIRLLRLFLKEGSEKKRKPLRDLEEEFRHGKKDFKRD